MGKGNEKHVVQPVVFGLDAAIIHIHEISHSLKRKKRYTKRYSPVETRQHRGAMDGFEESVAGVDDEVVILKHQQGEQRQHASTDYQQMLRPLGLASLNEQGKIISNECYA